MTTNHPAHGPVSLDRLHQISEILSKAAAQSDGGNLGYAMADAVKVIDVAISALGADPQRNPVLAYADSYRDMAKREVESIPVWSVITDLERNIAPLYGASPATPSDREPVKMFGIGSVFKPQIVSEEDVDCDNCAHYEPNICHGEGCPAALLHITKTEPVVPEELLSAMEEVLRISDHDHEAWNKVRSGIASYRAAMLQAEPASNSDELPLDYLQGHKDGLEWAAQLAEANHPQTGDWLYDDPIELARAIRKGPDIPEFKSVSVDEDDNFYSWFGRFWYENYQKNNYTTSAKQMLGTMAEFAYRAGRESAALAGNSPVIPDGWQLVPKEPTEAMNKAGWAAMNEHDAINPTYRAMLAAAPQQENV